MKKKDLTNKQFITILIISIVVLFLLVEIVNFFMILYSDSYYVWPPGIQKNFYPNKSITAGIHDPSVFSINKLGYRGDLIKGEEEYRILTMGGSTTECLYLDNSEAWPYILDNLLHKTNNQKEVVVLNVGKSGHSTHQHVLQIKHLPEQYEPDLIILLVGLNDIFKLLLHKEMSDSLDLDYSRAFTLSPEYTFRRSVTYKLVRFFYHLCVSGFKPQDSLGKFYVNSRIQRTSGKILNEMPEKYNEELQKYSDRLKIIVQQATKKNITLLFATQPFLWKENMSSEEIQSLWLGFTQDKEYYSPEILAELTNMYNAEVLKTCEKYSGVMCIDLESKIPKINQYMYDDVHFNEKGSEAVAKEFEKFIKQTLPEFKSMPEENLQQ